MKIIHQNGYSREELLLFRLTIYKSERSPQTAPCLCGSSPLPPFSRCHRLGPGTRPRYPQVQARTDRIRQSREPKPPLPVARLGHSLTWSRSPQAFAEKILEYRLDADSFSSGSPALGSTRGEPAHASYGGGLSPDIVRSIDSLWHDPIIPSVLDRSSEFYLMDSAS